MRPKSVVLQSKKKLQVHEIIFFSKKKFFQLLYLQKWSSKQCADFFKNKCVSRYLSFNDFKVPNFVLHNKIINKTRSAKNQENFAHRFGDNYLTNHLVKFQQDRIKPWSFGALRVCTGYHLRNSLVHFPKIHRSVLRKTTIDLLYFWGVYDVNLWEKHFGKTFRQKHGSLMQNKCLYILSSF